MILDEFVLLAADSNRTKAYLQVMGEHGYFPALCIVLLDKETEIEETGNNVCAQEEIKYFDWKKSLLQILQENSIDYRFAYNMDVNSKQVEEILRELKQKYVIYSGYGGTILKEHLFSLGKKFIHVHAGILPQYRGSTTGYYSILQENSIGASAIFMDETIDTGQVIFSDRFSLPNDSVNIDYIYEPFIRAKVLVETLHLYFKNGKRFLSSVQEGEEETYYIIHPVLKHIALLKVEAERINR